MGINKKLMDIQAELKAPKNQRNTFGNYNYRSCEDILEAVKPLLKKYKATLMIRDDIEIVGDRFYVKATATFLDTETDEVLCNTAYAREALEKKGLDASQITGTASSYARKYCLNGLFLIDDTKDADTDEYKNQQDAKKATDKQEKDAKGVNKATFKQIEIMKKICDENNLEFDEKTARDMSIKDASDFIAKFRKEN